MIPRATVATGLSLLLAAALAAAPPPYATGVLEGRVHLAKLPARRTVERYVPGGGAVREVQSVPAVVFIRGPAAGAAASGRPALMAQRDTTFVPAVLAVPVGASVEFPNQDPFFHNVFSYSSTQRFDLGRYPRGESKSVRFERPGIVNVYCEVHESMRAAILVTENPWHAIVDDDGRFRIAGVPAGRHTLVAWHPDFGEKETPVEVRDGRSTRADIRFQ